MSSQKPPQIYIVDDEPMVLKAVSQSVSSLGYNVSTFDNPLQCLEVLSHRPCDLIISDVNMPDMDGIAFLQRIKDSRPEIGVLLITGYGDIPLAVEAVKLGAIDFLEKPLNEETLLPRIRSIVSTLSTKEPLPLTEAERTILRLIASGKSNKEIAHILERSVRTIENHRHRLMHKLNAENAADLTKIAISHGLISIPST